MRTRAAANAALRAAVRGDDMQSKWKLMANGQARQERQGKVMFTACLHQQPEEV
ncbi:hypothetical protein C1H46_014784 [Malus baccata]|uniref:Uncharacterized protein n=1 Tax=Malus baccata TaxID=106549 RepID=A0A540MLJ5_MALBA|nr:hypothetical protein C1H46_014784 [Malus baccata]